ncbi:GyrI-like domain-containing protein [Brevibacillus ruminantium]|uniref:GyrI-like domain-containing protein n=1 Tax=Brevibacillus ruminantium TaxID=2950604 RepID=A0ABY4WCV5_9BACL|nr:GyrI-like domain-containing protein [Brevibacillus ruminantium]USG64995.1 GyrI-like domain-containing protein [Brevibacillus ruminantium]
MEPKIIFLDAMNLEGIAARTTNAREVSGEGEIPGLWEQFFRANVTSRIGQIKHPQRLYALYANYENGAEGTYTVLLGHETKPGEQTGEGLEAISIPAAKYAVFTTEKGPVDVVVTEAWKRIWAWSSAANVRRTFTGDFELYNAHDFDPGQAVVEIYIAIE